MNRNTFNLIAYNIVFFFIWMHCFLGYVHFDYEYVHVFIGFISLFSLIILFHSQVSGHIAVKYGGSIIYYGASLFVYSGPFWTNPLHFALLASILGIYFIENYTAYLRHFVLFSIVSYIMTITFYFVMPYAIIGLEGETMDFDTSISDNEEEQASGIDRLPILQLDDLPFYSYNKDTIDFKEDTYHLLMTWNEKCGPCKVAMKDFEPLIKSDLPDIQHFYVYEKMGKQQGIDSLKYFSAAMIKRASSMFLIDYDEHFTNKNDLGGFPYFFLFDKQGRLIFKQLGYDPQQKYKMIEKMKVAMKG
jgi:thioredoxin-related protein